MVEEHELPEPGEIVVCKVKQVLNYGAFAELVEYGNEKGFVHVSQVSTRWVKNIRNHVKEGQIRAAKVLSINRDRHQIDLSFTKVSSNAQRARIEEWKQLKRCRKMLENLAKEQKREEDEVWEKVAKPLLDNYETLAEAFLEIVVKGEQAAKGVDKALMQPLLELVKKNVSVPEKTLQGAISIKLLKPDAIDSIKQALEKAGKAAKNTELFYKGGGKYALKVMAPDFKQAEKSLDKVVETLEKEIKAAGGEASFERSE
jgi:translation initiation factor 2 subunit 1